MAASSATVASFGNAIATTEGYGQSASNKPTRTNNPGDLGNTDDGSTRTYPTQEAGYDALYSQSAGMLNGTSSVYNPNMTLAEAGTHYASDPNWAPTMANTLGVPVDTKLGDIASGAVPIKMVAQPQTSTDLNGSGSSAPATPEAAFLGVDNSDPAAALPVSGMAIPANQIDAINNAVQPSLIIDSGLTQTAWYNDPSILQVDGATQAVNYPVTFRIFFDDGSALPISICLMASVRTHQRSMRHVITKQQTRTGVLVNFWGMAPDQITGSASTGLMSNQLGVTDYLSLTTASNALKQSVMQAFQSADLAASDEVEASMNSSSGYFRIAAKDAFIEVLSMFKNNGNVWFRNQNYTGITTSMDQVGVDAWSDVTGSSTFQNVSRRNDVMTRGRVVMYFRNAQYSGYFKSLSWVMDAKNPFRWNFNFVFQVESTHFGVEVPQR